MTKLTAIVLTKNEEEKVGDCLESLSFADEIIVIDNGSTDKTVEVAKSKGAKVINEPPRGFAASRNRGLAAASGDWVLYLDADELVGPELRKELVSKLTKTDKTAFFIPRRNIILGQEMKHGGWYPDYVKRLFRRSTLKKWEGELHEEPIFDGTHGYMESAIIHTKHDKITDMITKTNTWSEIEGKLLYDASHPKMAGWRIFRILLSEAWYRLVIKRGVLDGYKGIIYGLYQAWSKMVSYTKLWERQLVGK